MCISVRPSVMSNTLIYSGEALHNDKYVHVLAYQNNANSLSNEPNAMILPFPTSTEMGVDNIIDTTKFSRFLRDIVDATKIKSFSLSNGSDLLGSRSLTKSAAKIIKSGSYTVVLAHDPQDIPEALDKLPEDVRPNISEEFLEGYAALYPEQPIAVCCWKGNIQAEPLLWWYEPSDKEHLFIPTMDAHDGKAPRLESEVDVDHNICVGSTVQNMVGEKVYYNVSFPEEVQTLLPTNVLGTKIKYQLKNGDMWVKTAELTNKPTIDRGFYLSKAASLSGITMFGWE